jgi:hypothetical protein
MASVTLARATLVSTRASSPFARSREDARRATRARGASEDIDDDSTSSSSSSGTPSAPPRSPTTGGLAPVSPRRVVVGVAGTVALALGANFARVTEKVLGNIPDFARANRLDVLYPVLGYSRCYKPARGYEYIVPTTYVVDQTMARRNATRGVSALDPPALSASARREVNEPDSAYGPIGSSGEENVSVITSAVPRGFNLAVFGDAEAQAGWLLENVLAKPGSGKTGRLIRAMTRTGNDGTTYYTFEYTIQTDTWFRHNVAVFATRGTTLYTFVAQIPETRWLEMRETFFDMADSFRVFVPTG